MNDQGFKADDVADDNIVLILDKWREYDVKVTQRNENGQTLVHMASSEGNVDELKKLIKYGAAINVADRFSWTPMHEAALKGHENVLSILLKYGGEIDPKGDSGLTPLALACINQHLSCAKLLLEYGADPHILNETSTDQLLSLGTLIEELKQKTFKKAIFECHVIGEPIKARYLEANRRKMSSISQESKTTTLPFNDFDSVDSENVVNPIQAQLQSEKVLTREEKKFLALLKTIENLENGSESELKTGSLEVSTQKKNDELDPFTGLSVKKKRGRPRKNPLPSDTEGSSAFKRKISLGKFFTFKISTDV